MHTLTVEIDQAIVTRFPEIRIGGFTAWGLQGTAAHLDSTALLEQARASLAARGLTPVT